MPLNWILGHKPQHIQLYTCMQAHTRTYSI